MKMTLPRPVVFSAAVAALTGKIVLLAGIGASAIAYGELNSEPYSLSNHFISELGWVHRSPRAQWFNWSAIVFCSLGLPIIFLMGIQIRTLLGYVSLLCGASMLLSGIAVALFPMDYMGAHIRAAGAFFLTYFLTVTLFTISIWLCKRKSELRIMLPVGVLCIFVALSFLVLPKGSISRALRNFEEFQRPDVWWLAVLEWGVLFSGLLWGAVATFVLCKISFSRSGNRADEQPPTAGESK